MLIISTKVDLATDYVIQELQELGTTYLRINSEDVPFSSSLSTRLINSSHLSAGYRGVSPGPTSFGSVRSIWYRRLRSPDCPDEMSSGVYEFCLRESQAALIGTTLALDARIMSSPQAIWGAEHKIYQLRIAESVGLEVPNTIISNEPDRIRQTFYDFGQSMVVKPVRSGYIDYGDERRAVYTTRILEKHLEELESAKWAPSIYQSLIEKQYDVRVTVVGNEVFTAAIHSQDDSSASIDWRLTQDSELRHEAIDLPQELIDTLLRFTDVLGLNFAAIDLIYTEDGRYVFLEVNPNGQWLWLDDKLDLGISHAVAQWLTG